MFGQNKVLGMEHHDGACLRIVEIFKTLQGEGPYSGQRATFIRLHGCNLRCWFCDTKFDDPKDPVMNVEHILSQVTEELVVLTGGEPVRQPLHQLIPLLVQHGHKVQVETAGTLWQDVLLDCYIVVSPKTPKLNSYIFGHAHAFKYIIRAGEVDEDDGLPNHSTQIKDTFAKIARPRKGALVYLSPCDEYDPERNQANLRLVGDLALKHGYIAGVQLHKLLALR